MALMFCQGFVMRVQINDQFVKRAEPRGRGSPIFMDCDVIGFGLQVRPTGRKSFTLDYSFEGRRRRIYVGDYPTWTAAAARDEAKRLARDIDRGIDPLAIREERFSAPTIAELVARYLADHVAKQAPDAATDIIRMMNAHVLPAWGNRKAADITTADVDALLAEVARGRARPHKTKTRKKRSTSLKGPRPTPIRANRVGGTIRKMFALAVRWKMRADNPASAFIRNPETPRERFLDNKEIERLSTELAQHPNQRFGHIIRLLLLTGARRGEVLNARWEQIDLEAGVWTKPAATTKQRRLHRIPLSAAAVQLLGAIRASVPAECPWVFPGDVPGKPVHEIKRFWDSVRKRAGIADARIHDLRHTFASLLVSGGMSLPMIGKLLGHTQVQTTQRYAHLFDDPLRAGLNEVGDMLKPKLRIVAANDQGARAAS
jgi:integrase